MHCILQDFEFGGLSRVSGRGLHVFDNFLLAHKFIRTEVILMCTILITVTVADSWGGGWRQSIQNECFLIMLIS